MSTGHAACVASLLLCLGGCSAASARVDRASVTRELQERADVAQSADASSSLPPRVVLADGLSREEAIGVGLWRSPALAAKLAELDLARATVFDAGLLQDPVFSVLFPWGPKQLEATLQLPLQDLWTRGDRIALAQDDAERLAEELLEHGVEFVCAIQRDFNELELRLGERELALKVSAAAREIARLERVRADSGDIALDEAAASDLDARVAAAELARASERVFGGERALAARIGLERDEPVQVELSELAAVGDAVPDEERLLELALACRPDLRAAELAIESAAKSLGLAREEAWRITAIIDANAVHGGGLEAGPGLGATLPLFRGSRGSKAIARAKLTIARARYEAVRFAIAHEVRDARAVLENALRAYAEWHERIGPEARRALEATRHAHAVGETSALTVLRSELRALAVEQKAVEARWQLSQARAELERAVGRRNLGSTPAP